MRSFHLKTKRRLIALIICAALLFSCASAVGAESTADEAFTAVGTAAETTILGDVDGDGEATIYDVESILRYFAELETFSDRMLLNADANLDGENTILDATVIQCYLAYLEGTYYLNMDVDTAKKTKTQNEKRAHDQEILDAIANYKTQKGVDISEFNGNLDMKKLKAAGYSFVMIRLGYGDDEKDQDDSLFETNVKKAEAAGLDWGAYIYSYALSVKEVKSEISHTLRLLKGKKPTMPIAFDWEDDNYKQRMGMPSNAVVRSIVETYLDGIRAAGYYPMLYTGYEWLNGALKNSPALDMYDIWYPQWNSTYEYRTHPIGMWQYGGEVNYIESPYISGFSGAFDKNFCYKNYPMIIKAYGYNNHTPLLFDQTIASTAAPPDDDEEARENLPEGLNGVMGDSMRGK